MNDYPTDADGDVLRRLEAAGFNFEKEHKVDFNVDFLAWPPSSAALRELEGRFGAVEIYPPEDDYSGYVLIQVRSHLTYDFVISVQNEASRLVEKYGGRCESWGVAHEPGRNVDALLLAA